MSDSLSPLTLSFEQLKKIAPNGEEYWMGRDLQVVLGYSEWRNFEKVIQKGEIACRESRVDPKYHFVDVNKVIEWRSRQNGDCSGANVFCGANSSPRTLRRGEL